MPRRPSMPNKHTISSPPPSISNISLLRQQWKWAAFSQFFYTFSPLFAMSDVTLDNIERDLVNATNDVLPRIMHRLLYTLSYDRKVSLDNWQTALRKQYNKRDPQANPLGPEPKMNLSDQDDFQPVDGEAAFQVVDNPPLTPCSPPHSSHSDDTSVKLVVHQQILNGNNPNMSEKDISINWLQLPMLFKLESMHTLIEWQFQHPARLRNIMKSDDESALWRIEPVGYDSKRNAYWFIGVGNRLWIQRTPPKPAKPLKRKRAPQIMASAKRPRLTVSTTQLSNKKASHAIYPQHSTRHSRAAKDQAIMKLDAQAKDLASLTRLNHESTNRRALLRSRPIGHTSRPLGTRISARLRGAQEEEWQSVPKEWLNEENSSQNGKTKAKTGLESDEDAISDLTELSEEVADDSNLNSPSLGGKLARSPTIEHREESEELEVSDSTHVEWETICTTLEEWERIAARFEKATHYSEKALYKVFSHDIVPIATQELREIEQKHRLEEALIHRKRSSRIASKESEREETRLATKKKQEDEAKLTRARRMEARLQKEEAGRLKRETAREQRRKEREDAGSSTSHRSINYPPEHKIEGERGLSRNSSRTPVDDWELCCEICHRQGVNIDDGVPMMSCALCSKWQHILCHNKRDQAAGHPPQNWDSVEFICQRCRVYQLDEPAAHSILTNKQRTPQHSDMPQAPSASHKIDTLQPSGTFIRGLQEGSFRGSYDRRPNGVGQSSSTRLSLTSNVYDPPLASTPRQMISFSHYQPAEHSLPSSTQRAYRAESAYHNPVYGNQQLGVIAATSHKPQVPLVISTSITH
ncbi:hypothetical protein BYT27DRAFT_7112212 [Phlegmacium glaucopus]|nr:hypothetical protein BYT27DRAFT_7112212 [Phlegmacium glaucopus]